ncbi:hypothetical protein FACS1894137_09980 [Spirochaetia bacterium]|nr:hypothetical protein FACS1894137_09980 [Spirochaetia bacterium]
MVLKLFNAILTLIAISPIAVVFLIQKHLEISFLGKYPHWVSYLVYIAVPIALTGLILLLTKALSDDEIKGTSITSIEQANKDFLPMYLGYFFVALSINDIETLVSIAVILFFLTLVSQAFYFNPLFLVFGYHFYYITTENKVKIFLISKDKIRNQSEIAILKIKRINDFRLLKEW